MPNIEQTKEIVMNVDAPTFTSWIMPIKNYIEQGNLPPNWVDVIAVKKLSLSYELT